MSRSFSARSARSARTFAASIVTLASLSACVDSQPAAKGATGTGAQLSVDYFGGSDVVGFHFELERVACDASDAFSPLRISANVDLVDGLFPGEITLVEQVFDETSRHIGADLFTALPPGCYDVMAAPAAAVSGDDWTPSADCSVAEAEDARVVDSRTTEVTLISQCLGDEMGALDTLVTLNHPPLIVVDFPTEDRNGDGVANGDDGKFNVECEAVEVCATITDVDDDPIALDWSALPAAGVYRFVEGPLQVIGFDDGHRIWEQCVEIVTEEADSYALNVTAWDLGYAGGALTRIEDLVAPLSSRDEMSFPVHTSRSDALLCFEGDGTLVPVAGADVVRVAGCDHTTDEEFYCSGLYGVDSDVSRFLCDGGALREEALYPDCGSGEVNCDGRDNDGDGAIDEDSTTGALWSWSHSGAGTGTGAGTIGATAASFDSLTGELRFSTRVVKDAGKTPNAFTIALNEGPNPKGHAELALLYLDCAAGLPIVTVYAYNGANTLTSWSDGSSASGTQPPDAILSSLLDPSFVHEARCTDTGAAVDFTLNIDTTEINRHNPTYMAAWDWTGVGFGDRLGIWFHPIANGVFSYSGGWISSLSAPYQSWLDTSDEATTREETCE